MRAHLAYLRYVLRHKWFVWLAGRELGVSFWQLLVHDWTKFLPCEWLAYVRSFYNPDGTRRKWTDRTPDEKESFNAAWNHHQKLNPHHWQYWVLITDSDEPRQRALPMPMKYVREMVADWIGAGRAITGHNDVVGWYQKNRDSILLHEQTRMQVEKLL
jgi:hypothetical protein